MSKPYVVVAGGGVIGASIANALVVEGARVTVLDAAVPGGGTSAATFAWVNAQRKKPEAYFRLNAEGMAEYHRLAGNGVGRNWFHAVGNVKVATDAASAASLDALVTRLAGHGYEARRITPREAAELEPVVDPGRITDAAYFPTEGWVDTGRMIAELLGNVTAGGGEVRGHSPVRGFEPAGARTKVVLESGEELLADHVVCAVGTVTERLLAGSGVAVPLVGEADRRERAPGDERYPAVGGLADTAPLRVPLRRVLHTPEMGLRPSASGRAVLGGDGSGSRVPRSDPGIFGVGPMLLERAHRTFPALAGVAVERVRVGVRVMPQDGVTVAGFAGSVPGLYVVVTHSGVTLAPYLGRLAAAELLGGREAPELAGFRPARFAGGGR
jgi:D-hydroxyproline dehydrogenase subunit beta